MEIPDPVECQVVSRVNRFVVEVKMNRKLQKAYINNTGRLEGYLAKGKRGYCLWKEGGKTEYRLFAVRDGRYAAIIDTQIHMKAFETALEGGMIPWLSGCRILKRNVRLNNSLIDYLIGADGELYLEVKSAVLKRNRMALYPDSPSLRGRRHLEEILNHVRAGGKGAILFIAAVPHIKAFKPNRRADRIISGLIKKGKEYGVIIKSIAIYYSPIDNLIYLQNPDLETKV